MNMNTHTEIEVRGIFMKLMTYTRSLELCARMNYETENLDFIDNIMPGEILYDLGACEGRFSIYAAKNGIRVIAFEPEQKNFEVFTQNIRLNEVADKITAINAGVGAHQGTAVLNIGQPWAGGHQKVVEHAEVRNDLAFDFVDRQTVNIVSLDEVIEKTGQPFPQYLKIDIDGSEMPFLNGAARTLQNKDLKGIIFELSEKDPHFGAILATFIDYGFVEDARYDVPNEPGLFNIIFSKR